MPKLKVSTPQPLEDLCVSALVRCFETDLVLCEVAKSLSPSSLFLGRIDLSVPQIAKQLSEFLSFLQGTLSEMVRQQLTTRVIKKYTDSIKASGPSGDVTPFNCLPPLVITVRLLEIILDESLHTFDLSELVPAPRSDSSRPAEGDPELWELVLNRCTGLQRFYFPPSLGATYEVELNSFVITLASQCNQLTELVLKDAVTEGPQVLSAIGKHCPSLRVLDLSGSPISCSDLIYLICPDLIELDCVLIYGSKSKRPGKLPNLPPGYKESRLCPKLRQLVVSNTRVRSLGVYYALKYLKNLESLGVCYPIANGIKKHAIEGFCSFNIKEAHTRGSTKVRINLLCAACPNLETLYISSGSNLQFSFKLHYLSKLRSLKVLTLELDFCLDLTGLKYVSQLEELKLKLPGVNISHIAEGCPLLKRLVIMNVPTKSFKWTIDRTKQRIFSHLEELQVGCPMSVNVAELIITEAKLLRTVKLVRVKKLTDQVLAGWLHLNPLHFLETWLITYAHLTVASVTLLLNSCQNLSTIGRLSGWDVRSWDTRRLEKMWRSYDINLVLYATKQDVLQIINGTVSSDEEQD